MSANEAFIEREPTKAMDSSTLQDGARRRRFCYSDSVDIFEAERIHSELTGAICDPDVGSVQVDLSQATRLDTTAVQILVALTRSGRERTIDIEILSNPQVDQKLQQAGISL